MLSLYLHFPFCKRKCSYCDFCSAAAEEGEIDAYCAALKKEIALTGRQFGETPVDTVFLGGGTPSIVPAGRMGEVLSALRKHFTILPDAEFTSEANPGTLTGEWLETLKKAGANRLSLGVQAKQERLLRILGRIHTFSQAKDAFSMARAHGFSNLNADAMFALPTQTMAEYLETLDALAAEKVTHLSAYSLILEEGTPLYTAVKRGELALPDEDETADMMECGIDRLETLGYRRYEISNFARPGYECKHNLGYWRQKNYLGLGLAAASLLPPGTGGGDAKYLRRTNTDRMSVYLKSLVEDKLPVGESRAVTPTEAMFETVMLGLRTVDGVGYADFTHMYGKRLTDVYGKAIGKLTAEGLLRPVTGEAPRLALTRRGLALQNTALMAFMEEQDSTRAD